MAYCKNIQDHLHNEKEKDKIYDLSAMLREIDVLDSFNYSRDHAKKLLY